MTYWDLLLEEVLCKDKTSYQFIQRRNADKQTIHKRKKVKRKIRKYPLGDKYPKIFFTRRESHCMMHFLKGKTVPMVASALGLSARTIEFYMKKMKEKLNCKTKAELIGKVVDSDFLKHVDFIKKS